MHRLSLLRTLSSLMLHHRRTELPTTTTTTTTTGNWTVDIKKLHKASPIHICIDRLIARSLERSTCNQSASLYGRTHIHSFLTISLVEMLACYPLPSPQPEYASLRKK